METLTEEEIIEINKQIMRKGHQTHHILNQSSLKNCVDVQNNGFDINLITYSAFPPNLI